MASTVSAIFPNYKAASKAIDSLYARGFDREDLSVLASENSANSEIKIEENSKAPEGVAFGGGLGGAIGATVGGLTAIGTITATGGAGIVAVGPIVAALAGGGAGAAIGGLLGGLVGLGIPETEAKILDEKVGKGYVMLGVSVDEKRQVEVRDLLREFNPEKVVMH